MAKATNLTRKKHDKPSAKIDKDGRHFIWSRQLGSHSLEPTSMCGINVVGGGGKSSLITTRRHNRQPGMLKKKRLGKMARALSAYHFFHLAGVESNSNSVLLLEQNTKAMSYSSLSQNPTCQREKKRKKRKDKKMVRERERENETNTKKCASFNYSSPNWIIKQQIESKQKKYFPIQTLSAHMPALLAILANTRFPLPLPLSPPPPPRPSLSLSLSPHSHQFRSDLLDQHLHLHRGASGDGGGRHVIALRHSNEITFRHISSCT